MSLSWLSSHLQMRWQATPAITVTIKVSSTSIAITSSRCRVSVGQHKNYIIYAPGRQDCLVMPSNFLFENLFLKSIKNQPWKTHGFLLYQIFYYALKRAFLISTVPSQTPVFMRLPGPVSAGNSQNILNMHTFSHIFGAG